MRKPWRFRVIATVAITVAFVYYGFVFILAPGWEKVKIYLLDSDEKSPLRKTSKFLFPHFESTRLPQTQEELANSIMVRIKALARKHGYAPKEMKFLGVKHTQTHSEIQVQVTVMGPVGQLSRFFYDIEHAEGMPLRIHHFSAASGSQTAGIVQGTIILSKKIG